MRPSVGTPSRKQRPDVTQILPPTLFCRTIGDRSKPVNNFAREARLCFKSALAILLR